ncbi:signal peptide-containing protein [Theileria equi strain WA]|uniref:Signal peptide-containing protein n=1 Tax=Theileria equi strain WA TaxID=1537102 RepID=L0AXC8_THEEQ|nr:signal peptide-containing protein [Theileria equi strain WA]AFZ79681.1 signal peptide-containing protein [Theileria equi strain WA]|eukprot:XP_004829347.1 signal peptide-containing protein [Theileria equi strain WA]
MTYIASLFLLLVYQSANCTFTSEYGVLSFHYPDEGAIKEPVIFNFAQDINEEYFSFEKEVVRSVVTNIYKVKPGFSCFEVYYGEERLWTRDADAELVSIHLTSVKDKPSYIYLWFKEIDGRNASMLFLKNENHWELMKCTLSENDQKEKSNTLRVDHVDEALFMTKGGVYGKLQGLEVVPKNNHEIKTILSKVGQIWHSYNDKDICKRALVFFTKEQPVIAKLELEHNKKPFTLYYLFDENVWDNVHKNRYDVSLKYLKAGEAIKKKRTRKDIDDVFKKILTGEVDDLEERVSTVELNIDDADRSLFYVRDQSKGGHRIVKFSPRQGNHIVHVTSKSGEIWDGRGKPDQCTELILHYAGNERVCKLEVMTIEALIRMYKINKGNTWEYMKEEEFEKKVKELDQQEVTTET